MDAPVGADASATPSNDVQQTTAVELVLHRLDVRTRLGRTALVSRAWHAAATAASTSLQLGQATQQQCSCLEPWLQRHGARLGTLCVTASCDSIVLGAQHLRTQSGDANSPAHSSSSGWSMPQLQLPVAQLQLLTALSLKLVHCALVGDVSTGGGLATLTGLQRLSVVDSSISLQGLASLRGLQHLELCHAWGAPQPTGRGGGRLVLFSSRASGASSMSSSGGGGSSCGNIAGAASSSSLDSSSNPELVAQALPHLAGLTHLALAGSYCCADVLAALGQSHGSLVELVLGWPKQPKPLIAGYEGHAANLALHPGNVPGLARLTSLRKLVVVSAAEAADPVVLMGLQLTHLQLDDVRLRPRLSMLAFAALHHLSINHKAGSVTALAQEDCAALTASSRQLTHLGLTGCRLPPNGCSLLFTAQLPHLVKLEATPGLFAEPAAMARIALACPRLEAISTQQHTAAAAADPTATAPYVDLSGIEQLPHMRLLVLHGVTVVGSPSMRALGQLTRLQALVLDSVCGISLTDVMQLASCAQLQELRLPQLHITEVLAANVNLTDPQAADSCTPPIVGRLLPQALLKQALWVWPFRLQHRPEELMAVAELLDASARQFGQQPDTSAQARQLQARMLEAGRALLMLQHSSQQQPVIAGARQQWQQQCQRLREAVLKAADELQGNILCSTRAPAGVQQQQQLATTVPGVWQGSTRVPLLPHVRAHTRSQPPSAVVLSAPAPGPFARTGLGSGLQLLSMGMQASTPGLGAPLQYQHQHPSLLLQPSMAPVLVGQQQQQQQQGGGLHMPPHQQHQHQQQQVPQQVLLDHIQAAAYVGGAGSPLQLQPHYRQYQQQQQQQQHALGGLDTGFGGLSLG